MSHKAVYMLRTCLIILGCTLTILTHTASAAVAGAAATAASHQDLESILVMADQGDAGSQNYLGFLYATGQAVAKDEKLAFNWFRKAAAQGHPEAIGNLAVMYEKGLGVARNLQTALSLHRQAAIAGNPLSMKHLAAIYKTGAMGEERDPVKAEMWEKRYKETQKLGTADTAARQDAAKMPDTSAAPKATQPTASLSQPVAPISAGTPSEPAAAGAPASGTVKPYYFQVSGKATARETLDVTQLIIKKNLLPQNKKIELVNPDGKSYRIQIGPFADAQEAAPYKAKITALTNPAPSAVKEAPAAAPQAAAATVNATQPVKTTAASPAAPILAAKPAPAPAPSPALPSPPPQVTAQLPAMKPAPAAVSASPAALPPTVPPPTKLAVASPTVSTTAPALTAKPTPAAASSPALLPPAKQITVQPPAKAATAAPSSPPTAASRAAPAVATAPPAATPSHAALTPTPPSAAKLAAAPPPAAPTPAVKPALAMAAANAAAPSQPATKPGAQEKKSPLYVEVSGKTTAHDATELIQQIVEKGLLPKNMQIELVNPEADHYRVRIGPFASAGSAAVQTAKIKASMASTAASSGPELVPAPTPRQPAAPVQKPATAARVTPQPAAPPKPAAVADSAPAKAAPVMPLAAEQAPTAKTVRYYFIQLETRNTFEDCLSLTQFLFMHELVQETRRVKIENLDQGFRLSIGPYPGAREADAQLQKINQQTFLKSSIAVMEKRVPASGEIEHELFVQLNAHSSLEQALALTKSLQEKELLAARMSAEVVNFGNSNYRARFGPFKEAKDAGASLQKLKKEPLASPILINLDRLVTVEAK